MAQSLPRNRTMKILTLFFFHFQVKLMRTGMKRLDRDMQDLDRQEKEIRSQIGFRRDTLIGWIKRASEEVVYTIIINSLIIYMCNCSSCGGVYLSEFVWILTLRRVPFNRCIVQRLAPGQPETWKQVKLFFLLVWSVNMACFSWSWCIDL